MRARAISVLALVVAGGVAGTALATFQPVVLYDPPKIVFRDLKEHNSQENVNVSKDGSDFVFSNSPAGANMDPESEDGCEFDSGSIRCPVAGIESIVVKLLTNDDTALIDLGSKADKVKQTVLGGEGGDDLDGGDGKQVLKGQGGGDELAGGPGPDVLNGGPGDDFCDGGPGKDKLIKCEPAPF